MKENYLRRWIFGWVTLAESLVTILTLGIKSPHWAFNYLVWEYERELKKNKHETIIIDPLNPILKSK